MNNEYSEQKTASTQFITYKAESDIMPIMVYNYMYKRKLYNIYKYFRFDYAISIA